MAAAHRAAAGALAGDALAVALDAELKHTVEDMDVRTVASRF